MAVRDAQQYLLGDDRLEDTPADLPVGERAASTALLPEARRHA
jgi:hypothetical protein